MKKNVQLHYRRQILTGMLAQKKRLRLILITIFLLLTATFLSNEKVTVGLYLFAYVLVSYTVIAKSIKHLYQVNIFDENLLMSIATIGALILGEYPEAVAVILLYEIGELFEDAAVDQSKDAISSLLKINSETANLKTADGIQRTQLEKIKPGQTIIIRPGEWVPLDGNIIHGATSVDTSTLTGESIPRDVTIGDNILSGFINQVSVIEETVTKVFSESMISKILTLVQNSQKKRATTEKFVTKFARVYTPVVVGLALLVALIPPIIIGADWAVWIKRALVFLVISCPCALVISIPLSFFSGIGAASKQGILVKGSTYLEDLSKVEIIGFDKTGTLTVGRFFVDNIQSVNGFDTDMILGYAAAAEQYSTHPIAKLLVAAFKGDLSKFRLSHFTEKPGYGIFANINQKDVIVGNPRALKKSGLTLPFNNVDKTTVLIAIDGTFAGSFSVSDKPKPNVRKALSKLKSQGIKETVLLTGDNAKIANQIGQQLGIYTIKADLLPNEKVTALKSIAKKAHDNGRKVAFVGDGINDTPVLANADIGIAMGGLGSDAAIEASDIVIMDDQPQKISKAISVARRTQKIVWQNIVFALGIKIMFLILAAFGIAGMWEAVFADVGVTLLAVLNALRLQL